MVLEAFVGPCPNGMECCHNDGNPANNVLANLRWDTPKANNADKRAHGTHLEGSKIPWAKLTEKDVLAIRRMAAAGLTQRSIADRYGMTQSRISRIVSRKQWRGV